MTKREENLQSLNTQFNVRYKDLFLELNKFVHLTEQIESLFFKVPSISLGTGGGTLAFSKDAFQLNPPAKVTVNSKTKECAQAVYRIQIPYNECSIAADNSAYFNYLFDSIMNQAVANYNKTFGGSDKLRWGKHYCVASTEGKPPFYDFDDEYLEIRLYGLWASDKDADTVTMVTSDEA